MSYFEFPHTRTYDSDLGWLIKTVKKLTELVDGRLRIVLGNTGENYAALKLKPEEDSLEIINRMFEKYLDLVQKKDV